MSASLWGGRATTQIASHEATGAELRKRPSWKRILLNMVASTSLLATILITAPANGQAQTTAGQQKIVGIISGGVKGTYVRIAQNLADVLDSEELRVLPMLGRGSQQNIRDLLTINGIDIAIVQSDVLDYYKNSGEIEGIEASIRYIAKLYNEEVHVVVRKDLQSVKQLEGAPVSVGRKGSGTEMTANTLFKAFGISIRSVNSGAEEALEALKAGDIDAAVFVVGKPGSAIREIKPSDGLKLLGITLGKSVQAAYFPTEFTHADYPNLVPSGTRVPSAAVGAVMAVFNWKKGSPRYNAVADFTKGLSTAIDLLQSGKPYHPKWQSVDLSVEVPGWTRFEPAKFLAR